VSNDAITLDRFLGGRVVAAQPAKGFRAGHDSVLLAAAVPADAHANVLELGSGAGVASLCLAARVPSVRITGIEADPELVRIANENALRNQMADRVRFIAMNVEDFTDRPGEFDHAFFNPPFHPDTGQVSPNAARDRATRDVTNAIGDWTRAALGLARAGGTVTAILRADRQAEIRDAAGEHGGVVFPLFPRKGEAPKRIIVRMVKEGRLRFRRAAGLVLHEVGGKNTNAAEAVLRHAAALELAPA
jgi:tRNA1(Val) A37 N6-methylase TrmN6